MVLRPKLVPTALFVSEVTKFPKFQGKMASPLPKLWQRNESYALLYPMLSLGLPLVLDPNRFGFQGNLQELLHGVHR